MAAMTGKMVPVWMVMVFLLVIVDGGVFITLSNGNQAVRIPFSYPEFREFYECLCQEETLSCSTSVSYFSKGMHTVQDRKPKNVYDERDSNVYQCYMLKSTALFYGIKCRKKKKTFRDQFALQFFYFTEAKACNVPCIGITGKYGSVFYLDDDSRIVNCNLDTFDTSRVYEGTTATVKKQTGEFYSQTETEMVPQGLSRGSQATTDAQQLTIKIRFNDGTNDTNKTGVIVGVVVAVIVIAGLLALGVFLWKKKERSSSIKGK